jgi:hypothetical protein
MLSHNPTCLQCRIHDYNAASSQANQSEVGSANSLKHLDANACASVVGQQVTFSGSGAAEGYWSDMPVNVKPLFDGLSRMITVCLPELEVELAPEKFRGPVLM